MREIWNYLWRVYPISVGGFAKFINVDNYANKFYMGDTLVYHGSELEADAKMSLFLFKQFLLNYYDTIVYDIPQNELLPEDTDDDKVVMSVGVSFPTVMLTILEASKSMPKLGKHVKGLSENTLAIGEFMESMCVVMTNYIGLLAQDNEIYPVTHKLNEYMLRYIPELDDDFTCEPEEIPPTIH